MVVIEIPANPNCEAVEMRVFHDLEPPRPVSQVRVEREGAAPQWFGVTGWTLAGATQPAVAQKVDDSGEGVALLIHGGDAGLRLRAVGAAGSWQLDDAQQWGLPFLLISDAGDVKFIQSRKNS